MINKVEIEAKIVFLEKFIAKIQEKNPDIIAPSREEIELMRYETIKEFRKNKGVDIIFE